MSVEATLRRHLTGLSKAASTDIMQILLFYKLRIRVLLCYT